MNILLRVTLLLPLGAGVLAPAVPAQEELPPPRGPAEEVEYYAIRGIVIPPGIVLEGSSFLETPDGALLIGTRRGEIWSLRGHDLKPPRPSYELLASGMHESFGMALRDGELYVTQQAEVTLLSDLDGDGRVDRYQTISDTWGWGGEHEFTYGSGFDADGYLWVALCLTGSYTSESPFRGWCLRVAPDGTTIPTCSGLRSPGGVGMNAAGDMFYTENQGPWNGACGLKHLRPGGFMGHPIGNRWYERAPHMGPRPAEPTGGRDGRLHLDAARIPELVPTAVWFPYKKMGQSASAIVLDHTQGRFGPFAGQLFVADYTLSLIMRVQLEVVDGVYQGACFPFREGFATGIIGATLTDQGQLFVGGSNRGWPSRGRSAFALQRLEWTGETPFEVLGMSVRSDGFLLTFTLPVDPETAGDPASYSLETYTYHYRAAYGSPEIDRARPAILSATPAPDGLSVRLVVEELRVGFVHELSLPGVRAADGKPVLHDVAYYTLNRIPAASAGGNQED